MSAESIISESAAVAYNKQALWEIQNQLNLFPVIEDVVRWLLGKPTALAINDHRKTRLPAWAVPGLLKVIKLFEVDGDLQFKDKKNARKFLSNGFRRICYDELRIVRPLGSRQVLELSSVQIKRMLRFLESVGIITRRREYFSPGKTVLYIRLNAGRLMKFFREHYAKCQREKKDRHVQLSAEATTCQTVEVQSETTNEVSREIDENEQVTTENLTANSTENSLESQRDINLPSILLSTPPACLPSLSACQSDSLPSSPGSRSGVPVEENNRSRERNSFIEKRTIVLGKGDTVPVSDAVYHCIRILIGHRDNPGGYLFPREEFQKKHIKRLERLTHHPLRFYRMTPDNLTAYFRRSGMDPDNQPFYHIYDLSVFLASWRRIVDGMYREDIFHKATEAYAYKIDTENLPEVVMTNVNGFLEIFQTTCDRHDYSFEKFINSPKADADRNSATGTIARFVLATNLGLNLFPFWGNKLRDTLYASPQVFALLRDKFPLIEWARLDSTDVSVLMEEFRKDQIVAQERLAMAEAFNVFN